MPLRLVLDTNVWLDWVVFDDAGVAPLKSAVATGCAEIFINDVCALELAAVLAYPRRKTILGAGAQAACMAECRRVARNVIAPAESDLAAAYPLPKCREAIRPGLGVIQVAHGGQVVYCFCGLLTEWDVAHNPSALSWWLPSR